MPNPYLDRLRTSHENLRGSAAQIMTTAATENRDMTDAELRSVETINAQAVALVPQIEQLTAMELSIRQVDALGASIADAGRADDNAAQGAAGAEGAEGTRSADGEGQGAERLTGSTTTQDRDPGHYRAVTEGGRHSFFADMYRSQFAMDDGEAATRLGEHSRSLTTTGGAGAGMVAPVWLTSEYEIQARMGRALANAVRHITLTNPAPITLPGQTGGTDAVVGTQANEGDAPVATDAYTSGTVTVTPKPITGAQVFSRQLFDMSDPAIDLLIYGDLISVYDDLVEKLVCATVIAAAGTAVGTYASNAAFAGTPPATPGLDSFVDAAIAVRNARKLPANIIAMGVTRYGTIKKFKDTAGRPLLPMMQHGPQNVAGLGDINSDGEYEGMQIIASDGISTGSFPEDIAILRAQDTIHFEGAMMRFRYEEVTGPHLIKVGIWAYNAAVVRQATKSVRRVRVTAA